MLLAKPVYEIQVNPCCLYPNIALPPEPEIP